MLSHLIDKHQRENFQVKVEKEEYPLSMVSLSVTHNKNSWSSIRLYESELDDVINAILVYKMEKSNGN